MGERVMSIVALKLIFIQMRYQFEVRKVNA